MKYKRYLTLITALIVLLIAGTACTGDEKEQATTELGVVYRSPT